jgi:Fic family protein
MHRGLTGTHRTKTTGGETVRAFVPHPLPPQPPLEITGPLQRKLEHALLALGRLDSVTSLLPNPGLFLYSYVRKEALLSSQIEGTQSSLSELLLFEVTAAPGAPSVDVGEVANYVAALEHGLKRMRAGFPLSNRLIREMHRDLLTAGRGSDKEPGEFRRSQNWIGGTRPGNARYVPPPADEVAACMSDLERYIHTEGDFPVLVKAALAHVQFETIHPFLDGNGRVGRLLITLMLCHAGTLKEPLLYLSLYLKQHRSEYYRLLDQVRFEGDWEAWLDFFLEGVRVTAEGAVATARRLDGVFAEDRRRILGLGRRASSALRVHEAMKSRPLQSVQNLVERSGLSAPTVNAALRQLSGPALAITREVTGRQRDRVFAYDQYLAILTEGTEAQPG